MDENAASESAPRVRRHAQAFNDALVTGRWEGFVVERFTEDAVMSFPQLPIPDLTGHAEIAAAYRTQPPTDSLTVTDVRSADDRDDVDVSWSNGGVGTMHMHWRGQRLSRLEVTFDHRDRGLQPDG